MCIRDRSMCDSGGNFSPAATRGFIRVLDLVLDSERNQDALLTADLSIRRELTNTDEKNVLAHPAHDPKVPG